MFYDYLDTPIGRLLLVGNGQALRYVQFQASKRPIALAPEWTHAPARLRDAARQLNEYFSGVRREFELALDPAGTKFQCSVWEQLSKIPYGETIHYGELARRVGNPNASRAVGAANGRNPLPIIVPCHRVIGADGSLTGFGGGMATKRDLLQLEQIHAAATAFALS
jgi:methylated-DNA-[protein]-cysteine S-methyltransferase